MKIGRAFFVLLLWPLLACNGSTAGSHPDAGTDARSDMVCRGDLVTAPGCRTGSASFAMHPVSASTGAPSEPPPAPMAHRIALPAPPPLSAAQFSSPASTPTAPPPWAPGGPEHGTRLFAALESVSTPGGTFSCDPSPCSPGATCSGLVNSLGEAVHSCLTPI